MNSFKIIVPATIANVGAGFDVLGFAIKKYLTIKVEYNTNGVGIINNDAVNEGIKKISKITGKTIPKFSAEIKNEIPITKGLGSSAAARVAGLMIADKILETGLSTDLIVKMASDLEGHPDNAVPAVVGGMTVCCKIGNNLKFSRINISDDIKVVVAVPEIETNTFESRKALPESYSAEDAIFTNSRSCLFLAALVNKEYELLRWAMEDKIHQPFRKKFIPCFDEIVKATLDKEAYGTAISGSGPSIFSFAACDKAHEIGKLIVDIWKNNGIKSHYFITSVNNEGVKIIE